MSIAVLNEVLDSSRSKSTARTLLIVMADAAHEDGLCWPGIERLAKRVNTSERNIQLLTRELEEMGELHVEYAKGRGNTNLYRVLPPLTLERLITELTARLEKVKDSAEKVKSRALLDELEKVKSRAEKVKSSAPLSQPEKVKSGAEKVKDSAEKVKSRAEKVKPISPEPTTTIKNQLQPNDVVRSAADSDLPDHLQVVVAGQGVSEDSGFADSSRSQVGEISPATGSDTQQEETPGTGAALAALTGAFSPWDATGLIGKFASRQGWLQIAPERIRELKDRAHAAKGNRYRGDLADLLDEEVRATQTPAPVYADDAEEIDMDALIRSAPLNPITARTK